MGNQPSPRLSQQATLAVVHHGDDHRVGPGIMLGTALGAPAHLAAAGEVGGMAADSAKAVAVVPAQLRPCLRHEAGVGAAHVFGGGTCVLERQAVSLDVAPLRGGNVDDEMRHAVEEAEKNGHRLHVESLYLLRLNPDQGMIP